MNIWTVTLVVALLDSAGWLLVAFAMFISGSDPATKGLDKGAGIAVTLLFLVTAVPSLFLLYRKRAPRAALKFELASLAVLFCLSRRS